MRRREQRRTRDSDSDSDDKPLAQTLNELKDKKKGETSKTPIDKNQLNTPRRVSRLKASEACNQVHDKQCTIVYCVLLSPWFEKQ